MKLLIILAWALVGSNGEALEKLGVNDPCAGMGNATYELGREYSEADCPAINKLLPNGECDWTQEQPEQTLCSEFCQVRTTFHPMQEIPIPHTYCRGPKTCSVEAGRILQVDGSWNGTTEAQMSALKHGVSGGFPPAVVNITAGAGSAILKKGECGYFTWIGTKKTVCGTLTRAHRHEAVNGSTPYCQGPTQTRGNYCVDSITSGPLFNPSTHGKTVFVRIDCGTRAALSVDQQDQLFRYDGVALPFDQLDEILQGWVGIKCSLKDHTMWRAFVVHGRGMKDDEIGPWGKNILKYMGRTCHAAVSNWKFDWTPDDPEYDWKSTFAVDMIHWDCARKALMTLGGRGISGC